MKLSASKIDLARRCLWPFRRDAGPRNRSTFAAAEGNNEHDHIEHTLKTGEVTPKSPTHKRWLEEWYERNGHLPWRVEEPFAFNPRTGELRTRPEGHPKDDLAWAPFSFVIIVLDAWTIDEHGMIRVVDWKTGDQRHLDVPGTAGQMQLSGLVASKYARLQGWHFEGVSLEYVKVNETRQWVETSLVTRAELLAFESELIELLDGADADPQPRQGWWCTSLFCPYLGRCPATAGALDAVAAWPEAQPFKFVLKADEFESPEHIRWQYLQLKAAEKRLEEVTAALKERAREEPVELGDGRVYGERTVTKEKVLADMPGVLDALRAHFGERASECIETKVTCTKTAIEDVAGEVAKEKKAAGEKATKAGLKRAVLADLHQLGAVKVTEYKEMREFKRGEEET